MKYDIGATVETDNLLLSSSEKWHDKFIADYVARTLKDILWCEALKWSIENDNAPYTIVNYHKSKREVVIKIPSDRNPTDLKEKLTARLPELVVR